MGERGKDGGRDGGGKEGRRERWREVEVPGGDDRQEGRDRG